MTPKEFTEQFLKEKEIYDTTLFQEENPCEKTKLSNLISEAITAYQEATKPEPTVKLPEKKKDYFADAPFIDGCKTGHNSCIDEIKSLNPNTTFTT